MKGHICCKPHVVYRCYDADDRLIYIGVTSRPVEKRLLGHRRTNPAVAEQTVRWTTETYPDRETALDVEANAVYRERPPLNYRFNPARSRRAGSVRVEPTREELAEAINRLGSIQGGAA